LILLSRLSIHEAVESRAKQPGQEQGSLLACFAAICGLLSKKKPLDLESTASKKQQTMGSKCAYPWFQSVTGPVPPTAPHRQASRKRSLAKNKSGTSTETE
jgi:hypothetical protein